MDSFFECNQEGILQDCLLSENRGEDDSAMEEDSNLNSFNLVDYKQNVNADALHDLQRQDPMLSDNILADPDSNFLSSHDYHQPNDFGVHYMEMDFLQHSEDNFTAFNGKMDLMDNHADLMNIGTEEFDLRINNQPSTSKVYAVDDVPDDFVIPETSVILTRDEFEWPETEVEVKKPTRGGKRKVKSVEVVEPSPLETSTFEKKKQRVARVNSCLTCSEDIIPGRSALPENSLYCSVACIQGMVEKCRKCVNANEKINFLDENGTMIKLPEFQSVYLPILEDFLCRKPNFKPFVDFAKLLPQESEAKVYDNEKSLKKEDTIRANVKKSILDQLLSRAKRSKVGISRKATMEFSEQIENELYRIHQSARNAKYKQWCTDFFKQINNMDNMFFKSVVTNVYSAKKIATMKENEMFVTCETNASSSTSFVSTSSKPKTPPPVVTAPILTTLDKILGVEGEDTTLRHNSHSFDANCRICLDKIKEREALLAQQAKEREEFLENRRRKKEIDRQMVSIRPKSPSPIRSSWSDSRRDTIRTKASRWNTTAPANVNYPDNVSERSYSPSRNYSPPGGVRTPPSRNVITPPPGVSPERIAVRRISPISRRKSPEPPALPYHNNGIGGYAEFRKTLPPVSSGDYLPPHEIPGMFETGTVLAPKSDTWRRTEQWKPRATESYQSIPSSGHYSPPIELSPPSQRYSEIPKYPEHLPSEREVSLKRTQSNHSVCLDHSARSKRTMSLETPSPRTLSRPENSSNDSHQSPITPVWPTINPIIWSGQMTGEGFDLNCSWKVIGNPLSFDLKDKIPNELKIKARVRTEPMWKFVGDVKNSRRYQVLLYLVVPNGDDDENYYDCLKDLEKSRRYAVLDMPAALTIKEAYLVGIEPSGTLPSQVESLEGPGLSATENSRGLLCVVVIKHVRTKAENNDLSVSSQKSSQVSTSAPPLKPSTSSVFDSNCPKNLEEMLAFIESCSIAASLTKGVLEYLSQNEVSEEEKRILQSACNAKIAKEKKEKTQSNAVPAVPSPHPSLTSHTSDQVPQLSQPTENVKESPKPSVVDTDYDVDNSMQIVEPDESDDGMISSKSPSEAGELEKNPPESLATSFLPPPPPPPPEILPQHNAFEKYAPRIPGPIYDSSIDYRPHADSMDFTNFANPVQYMSPADFPRPFAPRMENRRGVNTAMRGRGNPGCFEPSPRGPPNWMNRGPPPSDYGYFGPARLPQYAPRFQGPGPSLPPQEAMFHQQRGNFRGRPTRQPIPLNAAGNMSAPRFRHRGRGGGGGQRPRAPLKF